MKRRHDARAYVFVLSCLLAACPSSHGAGPDTDSGTASPERRSDAGAGARPERTPIPPPMQLCDCCGTQVEWPADTSCDLGACDGLCGACRCEPPPPGCAWAEAPPCCSELICEDRPESSCARMDARAAPCADRCAADVVGLAWDGQRCRAIECGCIGEDCDELYATRDECQRAHAQCDATLCDATGGTWLAQERYCGRQACGARPPQDCENGSAICDCGTGREFVPGTGCESTVCDPVELCVATGGSLPPCDDLNEDCDSDCLCPEGFAFGRGAGCIPSEGAQERELCLGTGGEWGSFCCASECGRPCPEPCLDMACRCGADQMFDPERGCVASSACNEAGLGEPCESRACAESLVCCSSGGAAPPTCQPPQCAEGTPDGCPAP